MKTISRCVALCIGLLSISIASAEDDCKEITTSMQVNQCAEIARKSADLKLNASYKKLMERFESQQRRDPQQGELFKTMARDSQRAWIKLRDTNCPLEATDIEPGVGVSVVVINTCIARMSLERSTYLDGIAPDEFGVSCPSTDFNAFLTAFAESAAVQRAFVQRPLQFVTTVDAEPEPRIEKRALEDKQIKYPLMPHRAYREAEGLTLSVKGQSRNRATAILNKPDTDYLVEYRFVLGKCWMLSEVSDFAI
ncbi:lysozyme inhibitor LprI family protein [Pseudomonas frederiksbergensis]|uniref:lysozyme inhibitor LprI family protein n=1 Tax=Pseudomonas frederiksbergensis TaxID=104087 RepID=UPI003D02573F